MVKKIGKEIIQILLIGAIVGSFISLFLFCGGKVLSLASNLMTDSRLYVNIIAIIAGVLVLMLLMLINKYYHKRWYNNGVHLIEEYYESGKDWNPFEQIALVFSNTMIAFYGGFLLGSEGPSVTMGASIGLAFNKLFKNDNKDYPKAAASAGFAVAFLSPVSGLCHLIEEGKKHLSIFLVIRGLFVILIAYLTAYLLHMVLDFHVIYFDINELLPFKYYDVLILVSIISVIVAHLYLLFIRTFSKLKFLQYFIDGLTLIALVLLMVARKYHPLMATSGASILDNNLLDYFWYVVLALLLFRIFGVAFSFKASVSGGIVVPSLVLGAIGSDLVIILVSRYIPDIIDYAMTIRFCGMLAVFAALSTNYLTSYSLIFRSTILKTCLPVLFTLVFTKFIDMGISKLTVYFTNKSDPNLAIREDTI